MGKFAASIERSRVKSVSATPTSRYPLPVCRWTSRLEYCVRIGLIARWWVRGNGLFSATGSRTQLFWRNFRVWTSACKPEVDSETSVSCCR